MKLPRSPAQISIEAENWLKNAYDRADNDRFIVEQRQYDYNQSLPISKRALTYHQVTTSEMEINGVRCMVLDPEKRINNRTILAPRRFEWIR